MISDPLVGSVQAEAFAMLQLKNNYFAWLLEAKERFQDELITDYDPDSKKAGKKNPAEVYLKKFELNISGDDDEDLVIGEGDGKYLVLKRTSEELIKKARRMAKNNATYKELKKALDVVQCEETEMMSRTKIVERMT